MQKLKQAHKMKRLQRIRPPHHSESRRPNSQKQAAQCGNFKRASEETSSQTSIKYKPNQHQPGSNVESKKSSIDISEPNSLKHIKGNSVKKLDTSKVQNAIKHSKQSQVSNTTESDSRKSGGSRKKPKQEIRKIIPIFPQLKSSKTIELESNGAS